jgi:hypothetical protein
MVLNNWNVYCLVKAGRNATSSSPRQICKWVPIFPQKSWRAGRGGGKEKFFEPYLLEGGFKKIFRTMTSKKSHKNFSPSISTKKKESKFDQFLLLGAIRCEFSGSLLLRLGPICPNVLAKILWSFLPGGPPGIGPRLWTPASYATALKILSYACGIAGSNYL